MEITAGMVKDLREKTGAGMLKCKEALAECQGDLEKAVEYLRKKGLASADKKADRATSQGTIMAAVSDDGRTGVIVEINCETDFVAKNEEFQAFAKNVAMAALKIDKPTVEALAPIKLASGHSIDDTRKSLIAKIGENMAISRVARIAVPAGQHGIVDPYLHVVEGAAKLGVLLVATCENATGAKHDDLKSFAHDAAMQVAAMKARFVARNDVSKDVIAKEQEIVLAQLKNDPKNASKPENILQKIVEGRMGKFFAEWCLLEQTYVKDDSKTIQQLADELGKKLGGNVTVAQFLRWPVGEVTEKKPEA